MITLMMTATPSVLLSFKTFCLFHTLNNYYDCVIVISVLGTQQQANTLPCCLSCGNNAGTSGCSTCPEVNVTLHTPQKPARQL